MVGDFRRLLDAHPMLLVAWDRHTEGAGPAVACPALLTRAQSRLSTTLLHRPLKEATAGKVSNC